MKRILIVMVTLHALLASAQDDRLRTDWANLTRYAPENKALKAASTNELRVVFMGNSITEGWLKADSLFFTNKPYINRGISGQTTPQMLVRFRQDVIELKPAAVVILAGINDIAENTGPITLETILGNIISMAELARANNIKVVLCSVLPAYAFRWRPQLKPADKVMALNRMIKEYSEKEKLVYVDYFSAMADERNGLDKRYTNDEVHPTTAGYQVMAPLVEKGIAEALKRE